MAGFHDIEADWLSCDEALARILAHARPMPATSVAAAGALGRSLAEPIRARATLPAWRNSAMDGFAVRSGDLDADEAGTIRLPVAGESYPGTVPLETVPSGAAVRVMTGGSIPDGFDSVIRVEHTDGETEPGFVVIHRTDDVGKHIRAAGKDMRLGSETVPAGARISAGKSGRVAMSLPSSAEVVVNWLPVNCV